MMRFKVGKLMVAVALLAAFLGLCVLPVARYNELQGLRRRLYDSIANLKPTNPLGVTPAVWDCALGETVIAFENIGLVFVPGQAAETYRLRDDLERKFAGPIDLDTLAWIWDRLARTGPHGKRYVERYKPRFLGCFPPPTPVVSE